MGQKIVLSLGGTLKNGILTEASYKNILTPEYFNIAYHSLYIVQVY